MRWTNDGFNSSLASSLSMIERGLERSLPPTTSLFLVSISVLRGGRPPLARVAPRVHQVGVPVHHDELRDRGFRVRELHDVPAFAQRRRRRRVDAARRAVPHSRACVLGEHFVGH